MPNQCQSLPLRDIASTYSQVRDAPLSTREMAFTTNGDIPCRADQISSMRQLNRTAIALASGGHITLAMSGAASGAAYYLGQALGIGKFSLKDLAVSTVAGVALTRALDDIDTALISDQNLFITLNAAAACGYFTSFALRLDNTEIQQLSALY